MDLRLSSVVVETKIDNAVNKTLTSNEASDSFTCWLVYNCKSLDLVPVFKIGSRTILI